MNVGCKKNLFHTSNVSIKVYFARMNLIRFINCVLRKWCGFRLQKGVCCIGAGLFIVKSSRLLFIHRLGVGWVLSVLQFFASLVRCVMELLCEFRVGWVLGCLVRDFRVGGSTFLGVSYRFCGYLF